MELLHGDHDAVLDVLTERIASLREKVQTHERVLIALAGVPGSGKSTFSGALLNHLQTLGQDDIAVVPMDGFHYSKRELRQLDDPAEAFRRRGAPYTFDAAKFIDAVADLKASEGRSCSVWLPSFDHAVQDPVEMDIHIPLATRIVIVEGNYVLLSVSPWNQISHIWDEKWYIKVPRAIVKQRIARRHIAAGIENTVEAARTRAEQNDLPNGDIVTKNLVPPDVVIELQ